jgi:hypothetical protein
MHKYFITRGRNIYVRRFIEDLSEVWLQWKLKKRDGKEQDARIQLVPRPVQLWELAYPEQHDSAVSCLLGTEPALNKILNKAKTFLAKLLGLKKAVKRECIGEPVKAIARPFVSIHILGNKKDKKDTFDNETL